MKDWLRPRLFIVAVCEPGPSVNNELVRRRPPLVHLYKVFDEFPSFEYLQKKVSDQCAAKQVLRLVGADITDDGKKFSPL